MSKTMILAIGGAGCNMAENGGKGVKIPTIPMLSALSEMNGLSSNPK